jgi:hypothetical protein
MLRRKNKWRPAGRHRTDAQSSYCFGAGGVAPRVPRGRLAHHPHRLVHDRIEQLLVVQPSLLLDVFAHSSSGVMRFRQRDITLLCGKLRHGLHDGKKSLRRLATLMPCIGTRVGHYLIDDVALW